MSTKNAFDYFLLTAVWFKPSIILKFSFFDVMISRLLYILLEL